MDNQNWKRTMINGAIVVGLMLTIYFGLLQIVTEYWTYEYLNPTVAVTILPMCFWFVNFRLTARVMFDLDRSSKWRYRGQVFATIVTAIAWYLGAYLAMNHFGT